MEQCPATLKYVLRWPAHTVGDVHCTGHSGADTLELMQKSFIAMTQMNSGTSTVFPT